MEGWKDRSRNVHFLFIYIILVAIIAEMVFLHLRMFDKEATFSSKVNKLSKELQTVQMKLETLERRERIFKDVGVLETVYQKHGDFIQKVNSRSRRNTRQLKNLQNVTIICLKGEIGRRGKAGPRGLKGDIGGIGMPGPAGPLGPRGQRGQKGQKGESALPCKPIEKPNITTQFQKSISVPKTSNLTLHCEASGNPTPNVFWEIEKGKMDQSRYEFPVNGGLAIANVKERDEGNLKCIAENVLGKDIVEMKLEVHTKPNVSLSSYRVEGGPGLWKKIECKVTGKPVPKQKWKKAVGPLNGRVSLSSDKKSIELKFNQPRVNDSGTYICEAESPMGTDSKSFELVVLDRNRDCSGWKKRGYLRSGIYQVYPDGERPFPVYCDMVTEGGGWTVIQRRQNESVDFHRDWNGYKVGFGNPEKEFWLGNEKIHLLTRFKDTKIRLEIEDLQGNKKFAEYETFYTENEAWMYRAHVSTYSGTAGDIFKRANWGYFETEDKYSWDYECARSNRDGWWYNEFNCINDTWNYHTAYGILKKTEIKVRVKN